jgi:hypothetical protein
MAHAVVIQVKIDPDSDWEHRHSILNDFILPKARALPGLEKGIWMNDGAGTGGTCVVVFDSEPHAKAAVDPLTPEGGPPISENHQCGPPIRLGQRPTSTQG